MKAIVFQSLGGKGKVQGLERGAGAAAGPEPGCEEGHEKGCSTRVRIFCPIYSSFSSTESDVPNVVTFMDFSFLM